MFLLRLLLLFFLSVWTCLTGEETQYISAQCFRNCADHIVDPQTPLDITEIIEGDIIYVEASVLYYFFDIYYPVITRPFILITHSSDLSIPGKYAPFLNDNKIIAWFGQNLDAYKHQKLHPIPIGLNLEQSGKSELIDQAKEQAIGMALERKYLLYVNFSIGTNPNVRRKPFEMFSKQPYAFTPSSREFVDYLQDLSQAKFVLSPPGGGLDCYRTWEALYMGAIPIVKSSSLNPLYKDLPIVVVENWDEITEEFLSAKYQEIQTQTFDWEKLSPNYWQALIRSIHP